MTSIGRIDPVTHHPDGTPIDPDAPASPEVLRELHADLVRGKRRGVLTSLPMAMAAIAALVAGGMNPHLFGPFISVGLVGLGAFASEAQEWLALRTANPLTLQAEEARERLDRQVFEDDFRARRQGRRPIATLALAAMITIVTFVEFAQIARLSLPPVLMAAALVKPAVRTGEWWRLLTATYLHGDLMHLLGNMAALVTLGEMVEAFEGRARIPFVYLAAAISGSVCSTLLSGVTSVGASGGILGLAAYLVVAAGRSHGGAPRLLRARMLRVLGATLVIGIAAFAFIDNAAHLGGALAGAALGFLLPRGDERRERLVSALGASATIVLAAAALFTVARLLR